MSIVDNSTLAFVTYGGTVAILDRENNQIVHSIRDERGACDLGLHPNKKSAVIAFEDGRLRVLSIPGLVDQRPNIDAFDSISAEDADVRFSPEGNYLAVNGTEEINGEEHCVIKLWSTDNWELCFRYVLEEELNVTGMQFSVDGTHLFIGTDDGYLLRWHFSQDTVIESARVSVDAFTCLEVSNEGDFVVAGNHDGRIYWFETTNLKFVTRYFDQTHGDTVWCLAFNNDDSILLSASADRLIKVWDLDRGALTNVIRGNNSSVISMAMDEDSEFIYFGTYNGSLKVSPVIDNVGWQSFRTEELLWAADTDESGSIVAALSGLARLLIWNRVGDLQKTIEVGHGEVSVNDVSLSRDGQLLAACGDDGRLYIWNTESFSLVQTEASEGAIECVAISPDGTTIASGGNEDAPAVKLWDTSGNQIAVLPSQHEGSITTLSFSDDGNLIAAGDDQGLLSIWHVGRQQLVNEFDHVSTVNDVDFMHDRPVLVAGCDDYSLVVWNFEEDTDWEIVTACEYNTAVECTPDDTRILSGGSDHSITFWDPYSEDAIFRKKVHGDYIYDLRFADNNRVLLSAERNGLIKLWNMVPPNSFTALKDTYLGETQWGNEAKRGVDSGYTK